MNRSSSGFSVVGSEPEGPRYDGRPRLSEREPRTEPPSRRPTKTRRSTRNCGPSGFPASTALGGFLLAKSAVGLEAGVDQEFAGLTLRGHAVLRYLS
jgi:hypothetical protein